jgi:hypothetical protein
VGTHLFGTAHEARLNLILVRLLEFKHSNLIKLRTSDLEHQWILTLQEELVSLINIVAICVVKVVDQMLI